MRIDRVFSRDLDGRKAWSLTAMVARPCQVLADEGADGDPGGAPPRWLLLPAGAGFDAAAALAELVARAPGADAVQGLADAADRLIDAWAKAARKAALLDDAGSADILADELRLTLALGLAAPCAPLWSAAPAGSHVLGARGRAQPAGKRPPAHAAGAAPAALPAPPGPGAPTPDATPQGSLVTLQLGATPLAAPTPRAVIDLFACLDAEGGVDLALLAQAVRVWTVALDLAVTTAGYADAEAARTAAASRPIGIGVCNLAPLLMALGLPYDSDSARGTAAALLAFVQAVALETSARLAERAGACAGFTAEARTARLWSLTTAARAPFTGADAHIAETARRALRRAQKAVAAHGLRNLAVTALDHPGAAERLLEASAAGIEPEPALVRSVPRADGSAARRLAPGVEAGLVALGLSPGRAEAVRWHIIGHGTLEGAPAINPEALARRGLPPEALDRIERALPDAADLRDVMQGWRFADLLAVETLAAAEAKGDLLAALGFDAAEIAAANRYACGAGSIAGAPHLSAARRAVFADAPMLDAAAQMAMAGAVQPFLDRPFAKTVPVPAQEGAAGVAAVLAEARRLGLHAVRLRRVARSAAEIAHAATDAGAPVGQTRRLAPEPRGIIRRVTLGGHPLTLRTQELADGMPGAIELAMPKESAAVRAAIDHAAQAISVGLQHGVPLIAYVAAFAGSRGGPAGPIDGDGAVRSASSPLDYAVRALAAHYLGRSDIAEADPTLPPGVTAPAAELPLFGESQPPPDSPQTRRARLRLIGGGR
ncbi:MAG: hypothetical protein IT557_09370 [Alphaproteobacteria bacterium]|nr:hypothetical protein [Alphaproteobacteria bacterium]